MIWTFSFSDFKYSWILGIAFLTLSFASLTVSQNDDPYTPILNCTGVHFNSCQPCNVGTFANESLAECGCCSHEQNGTCIDATKCTGCSEGEYQPWSGQTRCILCPSGSSTENKTHSMNCTECTPGHFAPVPGSPFCLPCPEGHNASSVNSTSCKECEEGYYQNERGQPFCKPCLPGTYCNTTGCAECIGCPPGHEAAAYCAVNCTECKPGTYKSSFGSSLCVKCAKGWYITISGATACQECKKGYFCPQADHSPIPCPSDAYCPAGCATPVERCSAPFYRNDKRSGDCVPTGELLALAVGITVVSIILVIFIIYKAMKAYRRRRRALTLDENSEREPITYYEGN